MVSALDALVAAFGERGPRLAVFDRGERERLGQWRLAVTVPIEEIAARLGEHADLGDEGHVVIPLHRADSAELTGEYVRYDARAGTVAFFDFDTGSIVELPADAFARSAPSWHVRFWHPGFAPPETPSYIAERLGAPDDAEPGGPVEPVPATAGDVDGLFERFRLFVESEREAAREEVRAAYRSQSVDEFVRRHDCLDRLVPAGREVDREGAQRCRLGFPDDGDVDPRGEHGLYPDTEVLVDVHDDTPGFPVEATIAGIDDGGIDLGVAWSTADDHAAAEAAFDADADHRFRVIELLNPVTFDRQREGVLAVEGDERKRAIVAGTRSLEFDDPIERSLDRTGLNQYQLGALRSALRARDVCCIHGPPGTGKTRTLVELVTAAVARGDRVLACAHSNHAVDNLLVGSSTPDRVDPSSLHAAAVDGDLVLARAGGNSTNPVVTERYGDREYWEADVVGATTSAAHRFRTDEFDLVVVDEATQATIPSTTIPWSKGERLVLAGDHKQLPPFTSSEFADEEAIEPSLFEHIVDRYGEESATLLRRQYRMHADIAAFPNEAFYGGRLQHGQRNRDWTIRDLDPLVGVQVAGEEERTPAGSYYNVAEAEAVTREVSRLLHRGVSPGAIGVITPYSGQVGKIVQTLDEPELRDELEVATVDAFQGSERDAIVVSFVRSNPDGRTGFLTFPREGPRRLNVALTRARKRCVLIGDWSTLRRTPGGRSAEADASHVYAALADHLEGAGVLVGPDGAGRSDDPGRRTRH